MGSTKMKIIFFAITVALVAAFFLRATITHDDTFKPKSGAYFSVEMESVEKADRLMTEVSDFLIQHPALAQEVMSHGMAPPTGYFYKRRGTCAAFSELTDKINTLIRARTSRPIQCTDIRH